VRARIYVAKIEKLLGGRGLLLPHMRVGVTVHLGDKGVNAMRLLSVIILLTALLVTSAAAQSQSRKEIYELQEQCGKSAAEMFDRDFPKEDRKGFVTFENHYNVRLNKCFMLEENTLTTRDQGKTYREKLLTLADVQDNKLYGSFSSLNCDVQETKCHSEQEFRALVRPYMEN
jgi:hypothetical protein